jgi:hypothetical protein
VQAVVTARNGSTTSPCAAMRSHAQPCAAMRSHAHPCAVSNLRASLPTSLLPRPSCSHPPCPPLDALMPDAGPTVFRVCQTCAAAPPPTPADGAPPALHDLVCAACAAACKSVGHILGDPIVAEAVCRCREAADVDVDDSGAPGSPALPGSTAAGGAVSAPVGVPATSTSAADMTGVVSAATAAATPATTCPVPSATEGAAGAAAAGSGAGAGLVAPVGASPIVPVAAPASPAPPVSCPPRCMSLHTTFSGPAPGQVDAMPMFLTWTTLARLCECADCKALYVVAGTGYNTMLSA